MSSSGVACDQTAPAVTLATSGDFFTANGTLTLTAGATDNVAVSKVVFAQDGVAIGTATAAPYTLAVPVTTRSTAATATRPPPLTSPGIRPP